MAHTLGLKGVLRTSGEGDLNVTHQDMDAAGDELSEAKADLLLQCAQLRTFVSDLVQDGKVTSRSSRAFDQSYDEFNTGATQAIEALHGLGDFLHGAATGFSDLDQQLADGLRG